ncbi:aldo/keto reductase [Caballeronia sp. TF1N1]|uniref:aldo/keto reductase n=1 Tax=Caballeronia sp. TF1N1 TaxID=2878153 RepID=UPI001FD4B333|nr:aldo/keto reductase [Caballeronia sp. TF1N1]
MQTRRLGQSSLHTSVIGLGCNGFGSRIPPDNAARVIRAALDEGVNFFDTADVYGHAGSSERILGEVLGSNRKNVLVATKFGRGLLPTARAPLSPVRFIEESLEASLKRLGTDYIDLYQLHGPSGLDSLDETDETLQRLVRSGKVRYLGYCNIGNKPFLSRLVKARSTGRERFVSLQAECSLLSPAPLLFSDLAELADAGGALLPFLALAGGMLTGLHLDRYVLPASSRLKSSPHIAERYVTEANFHRVRRLGEYAASRGRSLIELSFGWLLKNSVVPCVIAGASSPAQVATNAAAGGWTLSDEEMQDVREILLAASGLSACVLDS